MTRIADLAARDAKITLMFAVSRRVSAAVLLALLVPAGALTGCSRSRPRPKLPAASVFIQDFKQFPTLVTVKEGQTVTWFFRDNGVQHEIQVDGAKSGEKVDGSWSHTFKKKGSFKVKDLDYPSAICTVVVE